MCNNFFFLQSSILFVIIVTDQSDGDKCRCLTQRDIHSTTINGFLKRAQLKAVAFKKGQQQPLVAVSNACFIIMNKLVGFFWAGRGEGAYHRFPVPCQSNFKWKKQGFLYRVDYLFLLLFLQLGNCHFFSKSVHQKLPFWSQ